MAVVQQIKAAPMDPFLEHLKIWISLKAEYKCSEELYKTDL